MSKPTTTCPERCESVSATMLPHPLLDDGWMWHGDPEFTEVRSSRIANVTRAADGIKTIARIVRNSLGEPDCSGAQPLDRGAEMDLVDVMYCLGDYIFGHMEGMRETAAQLAKLREEAGHE